jgi:hypothetical protein
MTQVASTGGEAVNIIKQEKTLKLAVKNKRLKAAWDNDYLLRVLQN